ncbi:MAG: TIGR03767 family metallophosphoesterase [Actinomycetes bacterium]
MADQGSGPSRRTVLRATALGGAVVGLDAFPARRALAAPGPAAPQDTTLAQIFFHEARVTANKGYARIVTEGGEATFVRTDLGAKAHKGRESRRRALVAFAQLTDVHVVDAQSPGRVEFLDRYSDQQNASPGNLFTAAYRPQEMLTAHVADAIVRRINAVKVGPVTGRRLTFAISTGDNVDNTQHNELRWLIDVLDGGRVVPDSGDRTKFEGVCDGNPSSYDLQYWHPDGRPAGQSQDDYPHAQFGYPRIAGLLDACRRPFNAAGLNIPWYSVFGNHDGLIQGNFPRTPGIAATPTGSVKVTGITTGEAQLEKALLSGDPAALAAAMTPGPERTVRVVSSDPDRRFLDREQTIQEHFKTTSHPVGHGFTQRNLDGGVAYYTFDLPGSAVPILGIVLDTVNPNGYSEGSLDQTQFAWLERQLVAAHSQYLDDSGNIVRGGARQDRLVVLFSHHAIHSLSNPIPGPFETGARVQGPEVQALLLRFPNVVLWVNGHSHVNAIYAHPQAKSAKLGGGFWEANTASHIDWPQQARLVEIVDNRDGTLSVFGTIIDSAAPASYAGRLDDTTHLAALSRELAANDWQERDNHDARRGTLADRNVELLVAAPFDVSRSTSGHDSTGSHGSTLAATGGGRREALVGATLLAGATVAGIASRGGAGGHRASTE